MANKKLFFIKKSPGSFTLLDESSNDILQKLKTNVWYSCKLKEPRNPVFHAKIFALMKITLSNLPESSNLNRLDEYGLIKAIEHEIGETEIEQKLDGEIILKAKSISFENMDNIEFAELYKKIVAVCETLVGEVIDQFQPELN